MLIKFGLFRTPYTYAVRTYVSKNLSVCPLHRRMLCSQTDDGSSDELPLGGRYIPQRIKKRLKEKGLTIDDLEYKLEGQTTEDSLKKAVHDSTVDKNVEIEFPSDMERIKFLRNQERHAYRPPNIDPHQTSIVVFPGQGSQFVGMGKKLLAYPGVEDLYNKASDILGYDLLNACINGPKNMLDKTLYCQSAVVVTSLAALERLKEEHPKVLENCVGVAGFSVGEFTAMIMSEMISFEDAIYLLNLRAIAMQHASERLPSGMLTVFCDHQTKLRTAMVAAKEYCRHKQDIDDPVCRVANFLCTDVKVVAGHEQALQFLEKYGKEWGVQRTKRLPVSGAFHTELMHGGKPYWRYYDAWDKIELKEPKFRVHSNMDGKPYLVDSDRTFSNITYILRKQLERPVLWEQLMHILYSRRQGLNFPTTFEVGPGRQLGFLLQKTNVKAFHNYKNIEC